LGGEDAVVRTETQLLKDAGHDVINFEGNNDELQKASGLKSLSQIPALFWSKDAYDRLKNILQDFKPDIAHFHNIYYALTPAVYDACQEQNVPVIQSLHNFRMLCANGLFFRDGHICEDCVNKSAFEGIKHACYRQSSLASAAVTAVNSFHHVKKTWTQKVDMYITATDFSRQKYIKSGIRADHIIVKPNVLYPDVAYSKPRGEYALYVGRLSEEKGVFQLLKAWKNLPQVPLKLVGEGDLEASLKEFALLNKIENVEFLGRVDNQQYDHYMRGAKFLVIPSQCYESFPRIAAEAFAYGLPVVASRLGSLEEIIIPFENGLSFNHLSEEDLGRQVKDLWQLDTLPMSRKVRQIYDEKYSPPKNLEQLIGIYQTTIQNYSKN